MDQIKAPIFHIIHGSFVDGYGIRTTVFLKGCPLKCVWCCNPEGQQFHPELKVTFGKCNACGNCVPVCPTKAITLSQDAGKVNLDVDRQLCTNCFKCIDVCYTGAMDKFGELYTVDELFDVLKKDEQFYRSSGGGVTIGGGEATCYPEFVLALIKKCKENYIHTAVDTCGYVTSPLGIKVLEEADLLLYDIKGIDPVAHKEHTGVSNQPILENIKRLDAIGKPMFIRVPVIPGYTDSEETLEAIASLLGSLKSVERVDIMAVHEFGKVKYEQLGMEYKLNVQAIPPERQEKIKAMFEAHGLKTQLGG
ncbi:MAG: pyruvate formate lyase-activating protein [Firmicutes bacterium]|nr:pyruvate formate lyase-activating protein [Bacillota bacterium]